MGDALAVVGLLLVLVLAQVLALKKVSGLHDVYGKSHVQDACRKHAGEIALGLFVLLVLLLMAATAGKWYLTAPFKEFFTLTTKYLKSPAGRTDLKLIYNIINQVLVGAVSGLLMMWISAQIGGVMIKLVRAPGNPPPSRTDRS